MSAASAKVENFMMFRYAIVDRFVSRDKETAGDGEVCGDVEWQLKKYGFG